MANRHEKRCNELHQMCLKNEERTCICLRYFKESLGDYGAYDPSTFENGNYEGRSLNIPNQITTMCTGLISIIYLCTHTKPIVKKDVPKKWLKVING